MFHPLICGASNRQEDADYDHKSHNKDNNKNPYSGRGLDKFSALLSELEDKKQKIHLQTGSRDISMVRFMYKDSTDFVPVVVKLKDKEPKPKPVETKQQEQEAWDHKHSMETLSEAKDVMKKISRLQPDKKKNKKGFSWKRPYFYLPTFFVLVLVLLVFFGRSVSILLTCVGWYMVPTIQGGNYSNVRRGIMKKKKKKDHVRKLSNESEVVRSKSSSPVRDYHKKS
ncbi:uncharacterized protein LOC105772226 [Gossypium raimondii]|uniref:ZCF37 n=2 Tax=Gossypium raimondii TaxID=29730 RepID=A0A0D2V4L4_GOSRA|nr:uncharacterized protein LOC105772226 [Gossypium raimondii]KJB63945.1 hypothetical protein B456_010G025900 [Gossypium raimondii]